MSESTHPFPGAPEPTSVPPDCTEASVPMAYLARAQSGEPLDVLVQSLLATGDQDALPQLLRMFYEWGLAGGHVLDLPDDGGEK